MEPHLAHRLPWQTLADLIQATRFSDSSRCYQATRPTEKQLKALYHFARCMHAALTEFAATDRTSEDEREELNPRTWNHVSAVSDREHMGYYDSIFWGYLELNLLLTNAKAFESILMWSRRERTDAMRMMIGEDRYGSHPASLATSIQQAFDGSRLLPLTADVRQTLRDHAGKVFRCMFSLLAPQGKIDADFIAMQIADRFGLLGHMTWWCETHGYCVSMAPSGNACRCENVTWSGASRFYA